MNKYKQLYQESLLAVNGLVQQLNELNPIFKNSFKRDMYKRMLEIKDMTMCVNRYLWENLPINLTSQQLESLFYRYGSLCFYVEDGHLMISKYTITGKLDSYGRLTKITPIDFAGKKHKQEFSVITETGANRPLGNRVAVIISDFTSDYQNILDYPRATINSQTTIEDQLTVYQQLHDNVKLSIKKALALCENEEQKKAVFNQVQNLINTSSPIVPVASSKDGLKGADIPIEMWNFNNDFDTQNYCQTIDYYDKVRRSFNGIPSPDTFEKKERKITAEAEDTSTHTQLVLLDGYLQRFNGLQLIKKYLVGEGIDGINVKIADLLSLEKEKDDNEVVEDE